MQKGICYVIGAAKNMGQPFSPTTNDLVIAADGGLNHLKKAGIKPDITMGDFDSLSIIPQDNVIKLNPIKDDTDTLAAIKKGIELGYKTFHFFGCTGGRLSHTVANIQCLEYLARQGLIGFIFDDTSSITVIHNSEMILERKPGYLSVFAMSEHGVSVTLEGTKYPLSDYSMTNHYPIGVSNEITSDKAKIKVKNGSLLIIFNEEEK